MSVNFRSWLVLFNVLFVTLIYAQEKVVIGKVTDESGFALYDASVKILGGKGVFTDIDGAFSIEANFGDTLEVSYLGLKSKSIKVGEASNYVIILGNEEIIELEGAVITALGITRDKKSLGYASQEIKGDLLTESRGNNALNALSGNVAGAVVSTPSSNLGGSTRILLRGIGSITGENRPLIVIDGVPMDNSNYNSRDAQRGAGGRDYGDASFDINPDDIETYNVLKGGPASALYGSRAANGVIMITTKSGKKGKDEIIFNTGVSFDKISIFPKMQNEYGAGFSKEVSPGQPFEIVNIGGKNYNIVNYEADQSWGPKYNPDLMVLHWDAFDPEFQNQYLTPHPWVAPKNNVKSFFKTGVSYTNSVSFSKSYENTLARVSLSDMRATGIIPNSELKRTTVSLSINQKFSEKLEAKGDITYVRTNGFNRPEVGYGDNSVMQKFVQWGQRQLDYGDLKNYKLPSGQQRSWNRTSWSTSTPMYSDNPYWTVYENTSEDQRDRFYGSVQLKYDLAPGLYAAANLYGDHYTFNMSSRVAIGSQAMSKYEESRRALTEMNYEGRLHYDKKIDWFSLNSFIGVNRMHRKTDAIDGATKGGLVVPRLYSLNNGVEGAKVVEYRTKKRVNSVYGTVSLGFKDLVFLEGTARNDWSSTLPEGDRSYFYPSVTGSLVFSQFVKAKWLNFGKLRAGWSKVGNDTDPYNLINTYLNNDIDNTSFFDDPSFMGKPWYLNPTTSKNDELKPESKKTWEIGLEMSMLKNRVAFDFTYYTETTTDLIMPVQVSAGTGYIYRMMNAGEMKNKGVEALFTLIPVRTEDFEWGMTFNFSKNSNKLVALKEGVSSLFLGQAPFKATLVAMVGEKYGQLRGTDFVYDDNGNKVVGANGLYEASEIKNLGSILPNYNLGIRQNFSYKNISVSALIDIQKGGKYFSTSNMWGHYSGMLSGTAANGVRESGIISEGVVKQMITNPDGTQTINYTKNDKIVSAESYYGNYYTGPDAQNVFDADYIKLREVTLSYKFPEKWRGPFADVVITAFARNLYTWGLDNKDFDPEMASNGSGNIQGLEGGNLPSTRSFGMNLKLQF